MSAKIDAAATLGTAARWWREPLFSDLRACPDCGRAPGVRLGTFGLDAHWSVECANCGGRVRERGRMGLESVVRQWNARARRAAAPSTGEGRT